MKKTLNIINLVLLILCSFWNYKIMAQGSKIYLSNKINSTKSKRVIQVKILTPGLYFKEGVNIYRKENNDKEWQKLTERPLQKTELIEPKSEEDDDYSFYYSTMTAVPANENDRNNNDFMILSSIITNNNFARLCGIYYEDETAIDGHSYIYKIRSLNSGKETGETVSEEIKAGDYARANPPSAVFMKRDQNRVFVRWKKEDRFPTWNLYRRDSLKKDFEKVNQAPIIIFDQPGISDSTTWYFQDTSFIQGKTYYYKLSGQDVFVNESEYGKEIKIRIPNLTPPKVPDSLSFEIKDFEVKLTWKYDHAPENIKEFNILRSRNMNDMMNQVNISPLKNNQLNYTDKVPKLDRVYYYAIEVMDQNNNINISKVLIINVPDGIPPAPPVIVSAIGDTGKVYLSFAKPSEDDFMGFKVFRSLTPFEDNFMLLTPVPVPGLKYLDTIQKTSQVPYYYKIIALDSTFNESKYSNIVKVKLRDILPPVQPFIKNIIAANSGIIIEWLQNLDKDLKGYYVYRSSEKDSSNWEKLNESPLDKNTVSFKDIHAGPGITYNYCIAAVDSNNNISEKSNIYVGQMQREPSKPQSPTEVKGVYSKENNVVDLTWSYRTNTDLGGFIVFRRDDNEKEYMALSGLITETHFTDKKITFGKVYHYLIKSVNKDGATSGTEVPEIEIK